MHAIVTGTADLEVSRHYQLLGLVNATQSVLHAVDVEWRLRIPTHDLAHQLRILWPMHCDVGVVQIHHDPRIAWPTRIVMTLVDGTRCEVTVRRLRFEGNDAFECGI